MPVGILFILAQLAICGWVIARTVKRVLSGSGSKTMWLAFAALVVLGLALGVWMACRVEYPLGTRFRLSGFPMPVAFFHLEAGQWVDFITPPAIMYPGIAANVLTGVALLELPLLWFLWRKDRRQLPA
jgi:hypothetical protein